MSNFKDIQHALAAHLKDPEGQAFEYGIEQRRLAIYRELFFNNILGFLSSGFPVLQSLYADADWRQLARRFMAEHHCSSPYFIDISLEFVEYLATTYQPTPNDPPFLKELAHYEWLELSVSIRQHDTTIAPWDGQSEVEILQFSPLASLVSYPYPVHQISPQFQPQSAGETVYLVVYRNDHDEVSFVLVNPLTAHLLDSIQQQQHCKFSDLLVMLQPLLPQFSEQQLQSATLQIVQQMLSKQILLPVFDG